MEEIKELADAIYAERVRRARRMPPEEKLSAGIELFEYACTITRLGIRHQFPSADDAEIERILGQRLALRERRENRS